MAFSKTASICSKPADIPDKHSKEAIGGYFDRVVRLCGGWLARKECSEYNFTTNYWTDAPYSLHTERSYAAGAVLQNGSWLIIGGKGLDQKPTFTTELLDNGMFLPNVLWPETVSGHCIEKLNNSFILIAGGEGSNGTLIDTIYIMNLDSSYWVSTEEKLRFKRSGHICGLLEANEKKLIIIAGGFDLIEVELIDMESMRIKLGPNLPFAMNWAASVQMGNSLSIIGGEHIGYCSKSYLCYSSDAIYELDFEHGLWKAHNQTLKLPRSKHIVLQIAEINQEICQVKCTGCKSN